MEKRARVICTLLVIDVQKLHISIDNYMQILHNDSERNVQIMSELKEKRIQSKLTQKEAAEKIGVSLRSYISYENDEEKANTPKYRFFLEEIGRMNMLDEEHGVLSIEGIRDICKNVFDLYEVDYCYLFGSYAKGKAVETSDVDLLIATETTGLRFFELTELLRQQLRKKVDLLDYKQLLNNEALLNEVLKDGVKIYG